MTKYKTLEQLRADLNNGVEVFWANSSYKVHLVDAFENCYTGTLKDGKVIRVTCTSNYFGSLLGLNEVSMCFSIEANNKETAWAK